MYYCYICEKPLTDKNKSEEHIFINAIGGRLKSKKLLCKKCNSEIGSKNDNELAKTFNLFANYLMIKRNRGKPQPIYNIKSTKTGDLFIRKNSGDMVLQKPKIEQISINGEKKIKISAENEKVLRQVLHGLKRKEPKINVDKLMKKVKYQNFFLKDLELIIHFKLNTNSTRSIVKTAINYYIFKNGQRRFIADLIPFIQSQTNLNVLAPYYPDNKVIEENENEEILHAIIIKGNNKEKILYAYIKIFTFFKCVISLNNHYNGPDYESAYFLIY